jgi:hypothetical protein
MMRIVLKILFIAAFVIPVAVGSCKKQDKCGCDGDVINTLVQAPVYIYYDTLNKSAQFVPTFDPYSTYSFCNPTPMMDKLSKFENGAEVLIDCSFFWDCAYVQQASNSSYGTYYKRYMAIVTDVYEDLYGN